MDIAFGQSISIAAVSIKLICATAFGFIVGINREKKRRGAGTRTHALVCMAACLVMITSEYLAVTYPDYDGDVARLGAQVISGMGFIGAGTIVVTRYNHIRGLTTAASLWATACLGLVIGAGFITAGIIATAIMMFLLITVDGLDKYMNRHTMVRDYLIVFDDMRGLSQFMAEIKNSSIRVINIDMNRSSADQKIAIIVTLEEREGLAEFMQNLQCKSSIEMLNEL